MTGRLAGRRAVVTGGARGIGRGIVEAFLREGASVAVWDLQEDPSPPGGRDSVGQLVYLIGDVSAEGAVAELTSRTVQTLGGVDILINNAGILRQGVFETISIDEWDLVIRVNLRSVFVVTKAVLPHLRKSSYGRIINIASQLGQVGGVELSHYAASKAAMLGLTKSLARELARDRVLVNAITPALIDTPMTSDLDRSWREDRLEALPIGRMGTTEEVAAAAVFLASDEASYFVGQSLGPNGGDVML